MEFHFSFVSDGTAFIQSSRAWHAHRRPDIMLTWAEALEVIVLKITESPIYPELTLNQQESLKVLRGLHQSKSKGG